MTENVDITRPIIRALERLPYVVVHRLHCGTVRVRGGVMQLEEEGTPDLLVGVANGPATAFVYLETKTPIGNLRPAQRSWHETHRRWGFRVEVPRSAEEALSIVRGMLAGPTTRSIQKRAAGQ